MDSGVGVILVAAGAGERFGGPKAFVLLDGTSLLERCAALFGAFRDRVLVLRPEDLGRAVPAGWKVVAGGARRRDSVAAGVAALDAATTSVLVHDAARPLASAELVARVVAAASRASAVVPALPVTDTIKQVSGDRVVATPDRSQLVQVQTPQAFAVELLRRALASSHVDATDEAALVEGLGEEVRTVPGEPSNLKVTTPTDLVLARALLRR